MNELSGKKFKKLPKTNAVSLTKNLSSAHFFYITIALHIVLWTVCPLVTRYTISHDTVEAFVWSQSLDFGYDKNPYFIGWLLHAVFALGLDKALSYYLLQQVLIGLGFWSVWKLGNLLFTPPKALIAVLICEGCLYFSAFAQANNDNFILIGLWGVAAYTFFLACKTHHFKYWLITGTVLGLAMMTKYSTAVFIAGLLLYLVTEKDARRSLRQAGCYVALFIFLMICLPNVIWLYHHDFLTVRYALARGTLTSSPVGIKWLGHPAHTLHFVQQTLCNFAGSIFLFLLTTPRLPHTFRRDKTNSHYLWCVSFFPIALVVVTALIVGQNLYWEWGVPFSIFWGLMMVNYFEPCTTPSALRRFMIGVFAAICAIVIGDIYINCYSNGKNYSGNYPAQEIADYTTQVWRERFHSPLLFVAGSRYTAGNLSFYSADKPKVFVEWNKIFSPGVSEKDIKKHGAIFIQDGNYGIVVFAAPLGY